MEYDYDLQVWFDPKTHIIKRCNHPKNMKGSGCCNADRFAGRTVESAKVEVEELIRQLLSEVGE